MKRAILFLMFTVAGIIITIVVDDVSYLLGITADFSDVEHYNYWYNTRMVIFMVWMMASLSLIRDVIISGIMKYFVLALAVVLTVVAMLMGAMFIMLLTGLVTLPVQPQTFGFLLMLYLMGTIGITMLAKLCADRYRRILDEEAIADKMIQDAMDRQVMKDFFADINRNFTKHV